ncbi:hypothetical protein OCU04_012025 [Sclerotinia nivalis]|uniref:Uncharacterized protein n=1 Tax=Sclerotinia nivalis TaxID=352851 RepID=A0A9X0AA40_9HELO|nr:hypothetical protein OCU04_012025 [Sclerotinia nivalis]
MCQHKEAIFTRGDSRTTLCPCPYASDNNLTVMACPYYVRELENPAEGDYPLYVEEAELRARKAKRVGNSCGGKLAEEGKGKGIDRKAHPNYPTTILEEDEEYDADAEVEQEVEHEDRPPTRASQRERPVAEPRTTPLKQAKSNTLARKMSDKVKQLAKTFSKKKGE